MSTTINADEEAQILQWLTPIDYSRQQRDLRRRRQEGTGQWLLNSESFRQWMKHGGQAMYCAGYHGVGKTMMTSIIVDYLTTEFEHDPGVAITYIYCSCQPQQEDKTEDILFSIIKQLSQQQPTVPTCVKDFYQRHRAQGASFKETIDVLESTMTLYSRVFILIDALDEFAISSDEERARLYSMIRDYQQRAEVNVFATSRFNSAIHRLFYECICVQLMAADDDILCYINRRIPLLLRSQISKHPKLQEMIRREVVKSAHGMFLLAQLYMDSLMSQATVGDIKRALKSLPTILDDAYEKAMRKIESQTAGYKELAKQILFGHRSIYVPTC
ncbi:hypothetical protein VTN77DRAFT_9371 [Rasamsonia byssochlamydoides]|uniref:uncharacterized protein n=1 Tax=Rasamsonia byssochlamydoides TaxID=89139 RepID=UPI003743839A